MRRRPVEVPRRSHHRSGSMARAGHQARRAAEAAMTAQVPGVSIDRSGRSPTRTFGVATALAAMLAAGAGCVAEEAVDPDPELVDAGDDDVVDGAPDDDRDADPGAPDARPDDPRDPDAG